MKGFEVQSAKEQVAARLREELLRGTRVGLMPGEDRLMARLGIGHKTVREAIILLEEEGWLEDHGVAQLTGSPCPTSVLPNACTWAAAYPQTGAVVLPLPWPCWRAFKRLAQTQAKRPCA